MESIGSLCDFLSKFFIFLLLEMPTQASGDFSVIGPTEPVQTPVGGQAELSCFLSPPQSAQNMEVVWSKSQDIVHVYQDGQDHFNEQEPNYQGRTELVTDAISVGNVTLKIWDVNPTDAGQYKCLFNDYVHSAEAFMELEVIEALTLFKTYSVWWIVIGILALVQLGMLIYYSWEIFQNKDKSVKWTPKFIVVNHAVLWYLLKIFLFFRAGTRSDCRGMDNLDEWVQIDWVYLAVLTVIPLLSTFLFVAVDFRVKRNTRV